MARRSISSPRTASDGSRTRAATTAAYLVRRNHAGEAGRAKRVTADRHALDVQCWKPDAKRSGVTEMRKQRRVEAAHVDVEHDVAHGRRRAVPKVGVTNALQAIVSVETCHAAPMMKNGCEVIVASDSEDADHTSSSRETVRGCRPVKCDPNAPRRAADISSGVTSHTSKIRLGDQRCGCHHCRSA